MLIKRVEEILKGAVWYKAGNYNTRNSFSGNYITHEA